MATSSTPKPRHKDVTDWRLLRTKKGVAVEAIGALDARICITRGIEVVILTCFFGGLILFPILAIVGDVGWFRSVFSGVSEERFRQGEELGFFVARELHEHRVVVFWRVGGDGGGVGGIGGRRGECGELVLLDEFLTAAFEAALAEDGQAEQDRGDGDHDHHARHPAHDDEQRLRVLAVHGLPCLQVAAHDRGGDRSRRLRVCRQ